MIAPCSPPAREPPNPPLQRTWSSLTLGTTPLNGSGVGQQSMAADVSRLSIRAMSWLGVQCLRHYCSRPGLDDERIWAFCRYVEEVATTDDVPEWDGRAGDLAVSGLGDPFPPDLQSNGALVRIVECIHEISASQIYGAWRPNESAKRVRFEKTCGPSLSSISAALPPRSVWCSERSVRWIVEFP